MSVCSCSCTSLCSQVLPAKGSQKRQLPTRASKSCPRVSQLHADQLALRPKASPLPQCRRCGQRRIDVATDSTKTECHTSRTVLCAAICHRTKRHEALRGLENRTMGYDLSNCHSKRRRCARRPLARSSQCSLPLDSSPRTGAPSCYALGPACRTRRTHSR